MTTHRQARAASGLWAISCYFNPCGYQRRLANFREFRRRLAAPLACVELSFDGRFELRAEDADVLVQLNGGAVLWQKERLLNIAWRHVPQSCRKIAWIDCDVFFASDAWVAATEELLDEHPVVMPFARVAELGPEDGVEGARPCEEHAVGAATLELPGQDAGRLLSMHVPGARTYTGLAWAARRDVLEEIGIYDACVVGSGNRAMFCAHVGQLESAMSYLHMNALWANHYLAWAAEYRRRAAGPLARLDETLFHLWHGDEEDRKYAERHRGFEQYEFDPSRDIGIGPTGSWVWTSHKPMMHEYVRQYFEGRQEDGRRSPACSAGRKPSKGAEGLFE